MATQLKLDDLPTGTDIVAAVTAKPAIVLLDTEKFDAFYEALKAKAPTDADVATKKGRDSLRSFAAEVRSEKASINKDRLRLTKEWRDLTSQVNEAGKQIDERLESLASEVRAPLTEWEEAEKVREARVDAAILGMKEFAKVSIDDTSATVRDRGSAVYAMAIDPEEFGVRTDEAETVKADAIAALKTALARLTKEEADRAELEKLRAEAAERERIEAERQATERAAQEAAERAAAEQERRRLAEQAEKDRIAAAEKAAEERARIAAEQAAQAERDRVQREHEAALQAERSKAAEAERQRQAEAERIAKAERERAEQEAAAIAEQKRREANRQHVGKIMGEAKAAIMSCGVSEDVAKAIVLAIKANQIPHVGISF